MQRPNVLLIILDTVRADHLSCYGYSRSTSPNMDRIAKEGVLYKNAYSASCWTLESLASMFTGLLPNRHDAHWASQRIDDSAVLAAELFKAEAFKTLCLSNNDCFLNEDTGLDRGFDYFHNVKYLFYPTKDISPFKRTMNDLYQKIFYTRHKFDLNMSGNSILRKIYKEHVLGRFHLGAAETNYRFKKLLGNYANRRDPFFGTLLYIDAHLPYRPPKKYMDLYFEDRDYQDKLKNINYDAQKYLAGKAKMTEEDFAVLRNLYDAEITYVDSKIGEVYDLLKSAGILDNTILIITSDHGENIGEHSLMDHRYCLYDTVLRVPLIIRYPEAFKPGHSVDTIVQSTDIVPTLMDIIGKDHSLPYELDGRSLIGRDGGDENIAYAEYLFPQPVNKNDEDYQALKKYLVSIKAIRDEKFKYIMYSDGKELLFNIHDDPDEEKNIIDANRALAADMKNRILQKTGDFKEYSVNLDMEDDYKERLKALGYL